MEEGRTLMNIPFEFINRKMWGAAEPTEDYAELRTPVSFVLHSYTDTDPCVDKGQCIKRVKYIQARDLASGLPDIKYNFLIGGDGSVYVGRGWKNLPDLNEDHIDLFERSIEIAHIGLEGEPPDYIKHTVKLLIKYGKAKKYLSDDCKYVQHFKEIVKDEEHYQIDDKGGITLTLYKKDGQLAEKVESDEYTVLSDLTSKKQEVFYVDKEEEDEEAKRLWDTDKGVEVMDGVKVDSSLLEEGADPSWLELSNRDKVSLEDKNNDDPSLIQFDREKHEL